MPKIFVTGLSQTSRTELRSVKKKISSTNLGFEVGGGKNQKRLNPVIVTRG